MNDKSEVEDKLRKDLADIYQYQKDIYEFCLNNGKLYTQKINKQTVYNLVGNYPSITKSKLKAHIRRILTEDRVRFIERIQYIGDANAEEDSYYINRDTGIITVKVAPLKPDIQDNEYIENYLESKFGEYKRFIKKYMAAYAFTNFQTLPVLVINGPRGTSKTTFVENLLCPIYPNMNIKWNGLDNDFNPEVEKKLAVIDENAIISKQQYNKIKSVTGSDTLFLNQKYKEKRAVRNNLQVVLISNHNIPMYVNPHEYPSSDLENQWFVWKFKKTFKNPKNEVKENLTKRLGHYIQTELRSIYEDNPSLFNEGRYGIRTPITEYEDKLFEANRSTVDLVSQRIKTEILEDYHSYLMHTLSANGDNLEGIESAKLESFQLLHKEEFITNKLIKSYDLETATLKIVVNFLKKEGILEKSDKEYIQGNEYRGRYIKKWDNFSNLKEQAENNT